MLGDVEKLELVDAFHAVQSARTKVKSLETMLVGETYMRESKTQIKAMVRNLEAAEETAQLLVDRLT